MAFRTLFSLYFRTCSTSHTKEFFGSGGLQFEIPSRSAFTLGCWPTRILSTGSCDDFHASCLGWCSCCSRNIAAAWFRFC